MEKALALVELARKAFGVPASPESDDIWDFRHDEARDLAGRIFGGAIAPKYNPIKSKDMGLVVGTSD